MPHFDHFPRPGEIDPYVQGGRVWARSWRVVSIIYEIVGIQSESEAYIESTAFGEIKISEEAFQLVNNIRSTTKFNVNVINDRPAQLTELPRSDFRPRIIFS